MNVYICTLGPRASLYCGRHPPSTVIQYPPGRLGIISAQHGQTVPGAGPVVFPLPTAFGTEASSLLAVKESKKEQKGRDGMKWLHPQCRILTTDSATAGPRWRCNWCP